MNDLHIFTATKQDATDYVDNTTGKEYHFTRKSRSLLYCSKCRKRRWAKNLNVQVYYDMTMFWCKEGCKRKR